MTGPRSTRPVPAERRPVSPPSLPDLSARADEEAVGRRIGLLEPDRICAKRLKPLSLADPLLGSRTQHWTPPSDAPLSSALHIDRMLASTRKPREAAAPRIPPGIRRACMFAQSPSARAALAS